MPPCDLVPKSLAVRMARWRAASVPWVPAEYQERCIKFMLESGFAGLLLPPGMRKTSTTLAVAKVLLKKKFIRRVLVIAPLRVCYETWPEEVCGWTDFKDLGVAILHGPSKDKVLRALEPGHQICLVNPEGVAWLTDDRKRMEALGPGVMLVVDESSLWKSSTTVRFRALRKHLRKFARRYILTGSPRPRNYLDLHGQVYLMDLGGSLGEYLTHYRNTFFYPTGYQMREWAPLPDSPAKIDALVAPMVMRLDAKDYLKLPKEMEQTHKVELPPKARAEYDRIEGSLLSTLFTQPLTSSAAARSKCCQIANGSVYLDPDPEESWSRARPVKVVHAAKVEALQELVGELQGEPLLCGIGYLHDVAAIRRALGADVPCINSQTTRGQAADFIDRWNRGELPVLLGHPASMGHGLNLQKFGARHVAFFDVPDNYDTYYQFFLRVCRSGSKADYVIKHHFVVRDTVDVAKMRNLRQKDTGQRAFLDAMKRYSEERRKAK